MAAQQSRVGCKARTASHADKNAGPANRGATRSLQATAGSSGGRSERDMEIAANPAHPQRW